MADSGHLQTKWIFQTQYQKPFKRRFRYRDYNGQFGQRNNQDILDTVDITDSIIKGITRVFSDTFSIDDSISKTGGKTLTDTITPTDK